MCYVNDNKKKSNRKIHTRKGETYHKLEYYYYCFLSTDGATPLDTLINTTVIVKKKKVPN